jgi:hypothetical protein
MELLADVVLGEVVGPLILGHDGVLAALGLTQRALGALPLAGNRLLHGRLDDQPKAGEQDGHGQHRIIFRIGRSPFREEFTGQGDRRGHPRRHGREPFDTY